MTWASPRTGTRRSGRGAPWAGPGSASPTGRAAGSSWGPGDRYWPVTSDGNILQQLCSAFIFKDVSNNLYLVIKPSARNFLFRQNISNQSPQTEINVTYRRIFWYNFFSFGVTQVSAAWDRGKYRDLRLIDTRTGPVRNNLNQKCLLWNVALLNINLISHWKTLCCCIAACTKMISFLGNKDHQIRNKWIM